uniref:Coat protein n=1 Tax=Quinoa-associated betapartitivirus 1 TaxID=2824806 RepID=A0A8D9PCR7_9VIRU|nr:TPA_asm: coat protein [Quinoa-associated betapartitivirus 1]
MTSNILQDAQQASMNSDADLIVTEVNVPNPDNDFFESFKSNSSAHADTTGIWNIDVLPNFTPILMTIIVYALKHSASLEYRSNAKCSPATICMYHLSIVYGFFLLNDLYVRKPPSAHARLWQTSTWRNSFAKILLNLPVPDFLQTILSQFHSAHTDRTRNVRFVPSAAGFSHNHYFGRFYPVNMFAAIHDCTASLPGNSTRFDIYRDVFSRVLYSIEDPAYSCYLPELIGIGIDRAHNTTLKFINSKLFQVFNQLFNPVLFRDFQKRSSLACLNLSPPEFDNPHVNAYDVFFAATPSNLRELTTVLRTVAVVMKPSFGQTITLADFISKPSGISILKHGYSTYALPTWVYNNENYKATSFQTVSHINLQTETSRAVDLCFLQRPAAAYPAPTPITDVVVTTNTLVAAGAEDAHHPPTGPDVTINRAWPWCLRRDHDQVAVFPRHNSNDLVRFAEQSNVTPPVLVLDTDGDKTITAHLATLTGKIIESFEIDGSTVPQPDNRRPLALQNALFADSAIPYRYAIPGSDFHFRPANDVYPPLSRHCPPPTDRLGASTLLFDRTRMMLPVLNTHVVDPELPPTLPGMTPVFGANFLRYIQSFLGFATSNRSFEDAPQDDIPGTSLNRLYVWSPYTLSTCQSDTDFLMDTDLSQRYFLTNLRTLFGTDYNLVSVIHPYEAMPID